jgi:hypothetical protein
MSVSAAVGSVQRLGVGRYWSKEMARQEDARLSRLAAIVEREVCAEFLARTGETITPDYITSRRRTANHMKPRRWLWVILRAHPDCEFSWSAVGRAHDRDRSTIKSSVETSLYRMAAGLSAYDRAAINNICERLTECGFRPYTVQLRRR